LLFIIIVVVIIITQLVRQRSADEKINEIAVAGCHVMSVECSNVEMSLDADIK